VLLLMCLCSLSGFGQSEEHTAKCLLLLLKQNNNRVNMGKPMQNQEYGEGGETLYRVSYM